MSESVISINNLSKSFGSTKVLNNINAEVQTGEIIGLLGLNGCGKTTLIETALGFSPASSGSVELFGHNSFDDLKNDTKIAYWFCAAS